VSGLRPYQKYMGLARELHSTLQIGPPRFTKRGLLAILAGVIAALCSVSAFLFLVFRDHSQPKIMVNEQSSPGLAARKTLASSAVKRPASQVTQKRDANVSTVQNSAANGPGARVPFSVTRSGRVSIGPFKLRLTRTDPARNTYDINVISGRRVSSHKGLKVDQPWWIVVHHKAVEFVATSVDASTVSGYWTESARSPQVSSRARSRLR